MDEPAVRTDADDEADADGNEAAGHVDEADAHVDEADAHVDEAAGPGPWARTSAFGFLLVVVAAGSSVILSIIDTPNAFALVISAVVAAVALLGAWLAASGRRIRLVVAVVLALLAFVANLGGLAGLALPASFWDFAPVLLFLVGSLTAFVAGIAALRRIGRDPASTAPGEGRVRRVVLAGVGVALVASAVLTATGGATVDPEQRAGAIEVVADDFAFTPDAVAAGPGERLVVVNDDLLFHTFTIDELGIDVPLLPGDEVLVELPADAAVQAYRFSCTPHVFGDGEGMVGTLEVAG